jgi:integrase
LRLAAVRRLAYEAADSGLLSPDLAAGIRRVKGAKKHGTRVGNWLTADQGRALLSIFDRTALRGKRAFAMVAILLGCGLRRAELAAAQVADLQQREEHWLLADLIGKGGHIRTVPIPNWVAEAIDAWLREAGVTEGAVFRAINKAGRIAPNAFSPKVIWGVVKQASARAVWRTLRRTIFAEHARDCATKPAESLNRFSSYSDTSVSKRPSDTWAANRD